MRNARQKAPETSHLDVEHCRISLTDLVGNSYNTIGPRRTNQTGRKPSTGDGAKHIGYFSYPISMQLFSIDVLANTSEDVHGVMGIERLRLLSDGVTTSQGPRVSVRSRPAAGLLRTLLCKEKRELR